MVELLILNQSRQAERRVDRLTAFRLALKDFRAGFLRTCLRAAVRFAPVALRFSLRLAAVLFLVVFFLLTTFRAFFATAVTAPPTALPALRAKPLAPSKPALAVSATTAPVPTTASFAVERMPPFFLAICLSLLIHA
jgi:hypothetical protein